MIVSNQELNELALLIVDKIKENFATRHLSGNLMNTIKVTNNDGKIQIEIPARTYNMLLFMKKGVVVYNNKGSYASKLDLEGSNAGNHLNYIDIAIESSLNQWINSKSEKYKMVNKTEM